MPGRLVKSFRILDEKLLDFTQKSLRNVDESPSRFSTANETATQSPLLTAKDLKSLRPKSATPGRNYSLPLKATAGTCYFVILNSIVKCLLAVYLLDLTVILCI